MKLYTDEPRNPSGHQRGPGQPGHVPGRVCGEDSHLHVEQSVQPLLVQLQLLLPPPRVELLQPAQLLLPPLLLLLQGQSAAQQLAGEGQLHLVDVVLVVVRTPPLLQFYRPTAGQVMTWKHDSNLMMLVITSQHRRGRHWSSAERSLLPGSLSTQWAKYSLQGSGPVPEGTLNQLLQTEVTP